MFPPPLSATRLRASQEAELGLISSPAATKSKDKMDSCARGNLVVGNRLLVHHCFATIDEPLLYGRDTGLLLYALFDLCNRPFGLHVYIYLKDVSVSYHIGYVASLTSFPVSV